MARYLVADVAKHALFNKSMPLLREGDEIEFNSIPKEHFDASVDVLKKTYSFETKKLGPRNYVVTITGDLRM